LQVRAANLQELVYKQGSAGITKATVSIVFHNNDPANGPSGYEDKEYITVTRQVSMWSSKRSNSSSSKSGSACSVKNSNSAAVFACQHAAVLQHRQQQQRCQAGQQWLQN
jgi:hypothetical protein